MKIVFLAPFGIRPKGTVIARMLPLAAELQRLGDTVTIVAPPYTNPEDSGTTEVVRGVKLVNVALPSGGKALGAPALALRMHHAALAETPDLIHLFKPKGYGGLAAMLHLFLRRTEPLYIDTDDWEGRGGMNVLHDYSLPERVLYDFQERWLPLRSAGVTVASRTLEEQIRSLGLPSEKVLYLPNCVEDLPRGDGTKVREKLEIAPEAPVVLLYTRFFEFSQERLHLVFAGIHRQVPEARFLVVGKGRHGEEELLLQAGREKGFADSLVMAGWVEPGEITNYLAAADVAVYPLDDTLVNHAKCPAKLTEIIRTAIPVVADGVGQATEYVNHDVSGILVDPASSEKMVEETSTLLHNRSRGRALGESGRKYLLERFSWSEFAPKLSAFYRRLARQ
jgi:glycosyltransferase involved in cell wall biosynthesis